MIFLRKDIVSKLFWDISSQISHLLLRDEEKELGKSNSDVSVLNFVPKKELFRNKHPFWNPQLCHRILLSVCQSICPFVCPSIHLPVILDVTINIDWLSMIEKLFTQFSYTKTFRDSNNLATCFSCEQKIQ